MNDQTAVATNRLLQNILANAGLDLTYVLASSPAQSIPQLTVDFDGPDAAMLTARNAELLLAIEYIAAKAIRLEPEEHDLIRFEAGGFKATRELNLRKAAAAAVLSVQNTGKSYTFPPMSSHERRLLHLQLASSGLTTASEGEGPHRHLLLHPVAVHA